MEIMKVKNYKVFAETLKIYGSITMVTKIILVVVEVIAITMSMTE